MPEVSTKTRPRVPFRSVLISAIVLWSAYFLLATLRWEALGMGFRLEMMGLRLVVTTAGVIITLMLWSLLRLFDQSSLGAQVFASLTLTMPVAVLLAFVNSAVFYDMNAFMERQWVERIGQSDTSADPLGDVKWPPNDGGEGTPPRNAEMQDYYKDKPLLAFLSPLTEIAFGRYFMMLAWCAVYFSMLAISKARLAERREQEFRAAAKAAELRSLRYQVNPHFLFNTLNSLSALVMTGQQARAEQMIQTISSFYRHSLAAEPTADVPLDQEFDLQRHYLTIEGVRFPDRLRTEFDLPEELAEARVPGMILQPLIENSVKYAVSAVNRPVKITVSAREEFDRLVLTVSDDGPGSPDDEAAQGPGFGIGLANVRDRLEARFGQDVSLVSGSVPGGYRSEIRIPLTRNG